jgi:hypothetical protein
MGSKQRLNPLRNPVFPKNWVSWFLCGNRFATCSQTFLLWAAVSIKRCSTDFIGGYSHLTLSGLVSQRQFFTPTTLFHRFHRWLFTFNPFRVGVSTTIFYPNGVKHKSPYVNLSHYSFLILEIRFFQKIA